MGRLSRSIQIPAPVPPSNVPPVVMNDHVIFLFQNPSVASIRLGENPNPLRGPDQFLACVFHRLPFMPLSAHYTPAKLPFLQFPNTPTAYLPWCACPSSPLSWNALLLPFTLLTPSHPSGFCLSVISFGLFSWPVFPSCTPSLEHISYFVGGHFGAPY